MGWTLAKTSLYRLKKKKIYAYHKKENRKETYTNCGSNGPTFIYQKMYLTVLTELC